MRRDLLEAVMMAAMFGGKPPTKPKVRVVENPQHTRNLFGPISEISGKELELLERNDQGDCLCIFTGKMGTNIVDVDHRDVSQNRGSEQRADEMTMNTRQPENVTEASPHRNGEAEGALCSTDGLCAAIERLKTDCAEESGTSPSFLRDLETVLVNLRPARRVQNFKFNLGDKVLVREIQRPGIVDSLIVDNLGPQYRVCYWNDSNRKQEWMYGWELELRTST